MLDEGTFIKRIHVVSTKLPDTAIVSFASQKLHVFLLYNTTHFSRCVWDGNVGTSEKSTIVCDVVNWLRVAHNVTGIEHVILDEGDAQIFEQVLGNQTDES